MSTFRSPTQRHTTLKSDRSTVCRSSLTESTFRKSLISEYDSPPNLTTVYPFHTSSPIYGIKVKKMERISRRKIVREVLGKMLMRKYLANKSSFEKIRNIPLKKIELRTPRNNNKLTANERKIVFKSKVVTNGQSSLIKSNENQNSYLMRSNTLKTQSSQDFRKFTIEKSTNLSVYPHEEFQLQRQEKQALLYLNQCLTMKIRKHIKNFELQSKDSQKIESYFRKVTLNFNKNRLSFIEKLRLMNKIHESLILEGKRKVLRECLNRCLFRRDRIICENLKRISWQMEASKRSALETLEKLFVNKIRDGFELWKERTVQIRNQIYQEQLIRSSRSLEEIRRIQTIEEEEEDEHQHQHHHSEIFGCLENERVSVQYQRENSMSQQEEDPESEKREVQIDYLLRKLEEKHIHHLMIEWFTVAKIKKRELMAAQKLACNPQINVFRAFSRLRFNAENS